MNKFARRFGSQACVVAIDAKWRYVRSEEEMKRATETGRGIIDTKEGECWFECSFYGGRKFMGVDAIK